MAAIRVTIWNEFMHERTKPVVQENYPHGLHRVIADGISARLGAKVEIGFATLEEPEHGLPAERLAATDVLFWWGHGFHNRVSDAVVERVHKRVLDGMGLIVLHSGHASKIFGRLMGTGCMLRWRDTGERERVWVVAPGHPLTVGINAPYFELPESEMYGEHFDIPEPDELIFISWYSGGEVLRSGCTFRRGSGRIFYFSPGHETFPIYRDANVQQVLSNAVLWATPCGGGEYLNDGREIKEPIEPGGVLKQ